jgi:ubiquinol-cytochrome c reductase cytochrome c subunit
VLVKVLTARRRHPLATVVVTLLALLVVGGGYAALVPSSASASTTSSTADVRAGRNLFLANCSTCHGLQAQGTQAAPTLVGVGAASVDFQVGTGRMPLQADSVQAPKHPPTFSDQQVGQLAAYVASLAPGPAVPSSSLARAVSDPTRISKGNELFRTNCAMCHNVVGAGGALTKGKYAPSLKGEDPRYVFEAMLTGPQSMPVFNDENISPEEKQDIASYLTYVSEAPSPGGLSLGGIGPVAEGLFAWAAGITVLIGFAVWLGTRAS